MNGGWSAAEAVCPRPSPPGAYSRSRLAPSYIAGEIEEVNLDNGGAARRGVVLRGQVLTHSLSHSTSVCRSLPFRLSIDPQLKFLNRDKYPEMANWQYNGCALAITVAAGKLPDLSIFFFLFK